MTTTPTLDSYTQDKYVNSNHSGHSFTHAHSTGKLLVVFVCGQNRTASATPVPTLTYNSVAPDFSYSYQTGPVAGDHIVGVGVWINATSGSNTVGVSWSVNVKHQVGLALEISNFDSADPVGNYDEAYGWATDTGVTLAASQTNSLMLAAAFSRKVSNNPWSADSPLTFVVAGYTVSSDNVEILYGLGYTSNSSTSSTAYTGQFVGANYQSQICVEIKGSADTAEDEGYGAFL